MIVKEYQLEKVIDTKKQFLSFLIYGPNEGLVKDQIEKITQSYLSNEGYEQINFNGKDLDNDPQALENILRTVSMFYKGKIVVADSIKDKHLNIIENVFLKLPQHVLLILRDNNLNKSSKIRKFFENSKICFSLACYEDDQRGLIKSIDEFMNKNSLKLNRDVKNYLLQSLSNDRMVSKRELEKIELYYKGSDKEIELNTLRQLLNDSSAQNLNTMNNNVMSGNPSKSSKIISKLITEGLSPISLIRSLSNYLTRIQNTKIEMKKGSNFETSIKGLKPPVFWKDKDIFQRHCLKWPLKSIEKHLVQLVETEIACKLNSKLANLKCEKSILLIANDGKQYFKN